MKATHTDYEKLKIQLTNLVFLGFPLNHLSPFQIYALMRITGFSVRPLAFMKLLALNSCSLKASPGRNRIEYIVIVKPKLILLNLLNEIYSLSIYPPAWKEYLTFFINTEYVNGVRPISLTTYFSKILEKMNKSRLQWWSETSDLLPSSQSGFRTGISCVDNLAMLTMSVGESFSVGKKPHNNHIMISVRT